MLLLVDAAQSVGVQHTDVRASNIDALAVSTQKGLLALYGMGFLYVRREWAERLQPAYLARFGVDLGDAHEASLGGYDYKLAPGARRFDLGNYNFLATAAVDASMTAAPRMGHAQDRALRAAASRTRSRAASSTSASPSPAASRARTSPRS